MGAVAIEHPISPNESEARGAQEDAGDDDGTEDAKDESDVKIDGDVNNDEYISPNHPPTPDVPTREEWLKHQITHALQGMVSNISQNCGHEYAAQTHSPL